MIVNNIQGLLKFEPKHRCKAEISLAKTVGAPHAHLKLKRVYLKWVETARQLDTRRLVGSALRTVYAQAVIVKKLFPTRLKCSNEKKFKSG